MTESGSRLESAFIRFLERPRLAVTLGMLAVVLSVPALFLGFYLDDYVARYLYGPFPEAERLFRLWYGGYGVANGNPADNLWQVEQGYAPWWIKDDLLVVLFRPLGVLTHRLDGLLFREKPALQHLHNLAWIFAMVLAVTRMYRAAMGALVGGLAALLFAVDHTHGFTVGYVCNRHALVSGTFGVLCLGEHLRSRNFGERRGAVLAPLFLVLGLLASEATIAVVGYIAAFALFADRGPLLRRALSLAPYLVATVLWRVVYNAAGCGARGSGMYVDPGREPLNFLLALLERGPVLLLGQYLAPPAEFYVLLGPTWTRWVLVAAVVFVIILGLALIPLLMRDRLARFWTAGMLMALVPAASAYPHNRQLLLVSFGALALVAQFWHRHAIELKGQRVSLGTALSGGVGAILLFAHLIVSPLVLPLTTCSIAFSAPLHRGIADVGDEIDGRDAVFVTAPDYFAVKLVQLSRRIDHRKLPRHWRALSFGPQRVIVHRTDERTLTLDYEGGILSDPLMELYRDRRSPTPPGYRVDLEGLRIEVLEATDDGRARRVAFAFDTPLSADSFRFYHWRNGDGFSPFALPPVGSSRELPAAKLEWGL